MEGGEWALGVGGGIGARGVGGRGVGTEWGVEGNGAGAGGPDFHWARGPPGIDTMLESGEWEPTTSKVTPEEASARINKPGPKFWSELKKGRFFIGSMGSSEKETTRPWLWVDCHDIHHERRSDGGPYSWGYARCPAMKSPFWRFGMLTFLQHTQTHKRLGNEHTHNRRN